MTLFDQLIRQTLDQLDQRPSRETPYSLSSRWPDTGRSELVMQRDAAFELGGSGNPSVNFTVVTTTPDLVGEDAVVLYGPDLSEVKKDVSFARIVLLEIDDPGEDDEESFNAIKQLEFVRYNVSPEGYMVRVSTETNREQVRVSRQALAKGINFADVGNTYIAKYKAMPGVKHVRVLFSVEEPDVESLRKTASKVDEITSTLTHILDGIPTDCASCQMKPICDEVDGLKEMHMKQRVKPVEKGERI